MWLLGEDPKYVVNNTELETFTHRWVLKDPVTRSHARLKFWESSEGALRGSRTLEESPGWSQRDLEDSWRRWEP